MAGESVPSEEGAQAVCEHLSPSVQRLCMASCGMGISGASAVAKLLTGVDGKSQLRGGRSGRSRKGSKGGF